MMQDYPERVDSVRIIHHEKNMGLAAVRNTALNNATGEFISIVDSDDWIEPNAIEILVQKQIGSNADIVSGNAYLYYDDKVKTLIEMSYRDKGQMLQEQLRDTWNMNTFIWGRLFKRSLFEENHIRCIEGCNYAEDRYLMVRLAYFAKSFATVDSFIYNYEKRNDPSITAQQHDNINMYLSNQYQHSAELDRYTQFLF